MELNNQRGQGVVEYILLLAVAVSLVMTFYRSKIYASLFGETGSIGTAMKSQAEFGYRHAFLSGRANLNNGIYQGANQHPSYADPKGGSRFFGPKDKYP